MNRIENWKIEATGAPKRRAAGPFAALLVVVAEPRAGSRGAGLTALGALVLLSAIAAVSWFMRMRSRKRGHTKAELARLQATSEAARQDAEGRARQDAALLEAARRLVAADAPEDVARSVAEAALTAGAATGAYLERISGDEVEVVGGAGRGAPPPGTRVPFPGSLSAEVVRSGEPELIDDLSAGEARPIARHVRASCGKCRAVAVPLVAKGEPLGALVVMRPHEEAAFEADEIGRARILADVASLALRRLLLVAEAEARQAELEESEGRFRELAENIREVFWVSDPGFTRLWYVSPAFEEVWGRSRESVYREPRAFLDSVAREDRERVERALEGLEAGKFDVEYRLVRPDGSVRWIHARGFPVPHGDEQPRRVVGIAEDVTERHEAEESQRYLAEAARVLSSSLDYESTLQAVARLAVPDIADWCGVDVLEDGRVRRLAVAHADPAMERLATELAAVYPPQLDTPAGAASVLRKGEPQLLPTIPDHVLRGVARDEVHFQALRSLGLRSAMLVPMIARGRTLGSITFIAAESGRRYDADDLAFAEQLAARAALAVDNARLYRDAEAARERVTSILERITEAFFAVDREWQLVYLNPDARRLVESLAGRAPGEAIGETFWDVVPEILGTPFEYEYRRAMAEQQPAHFEEFLAAWNVWFEVHAYPSPEGLSVFFREISERKRNERALQLLAEAGAVLAASLDYHESLSGVARLAVSSFADYCLVDLLEDDGLRRVAGAAHARGDERLVARATRLTLGADSPLLQPLTSGEPLLLERLDDAQLESLAPTDEQRQLYRQAGARSLLAVPLLARGHALGVMTFSMAESERRFSREDVPLAQELARRAAAAVDNARLFQRAEQQARDQAALREAAAAVSKPFSLREIVEQIAASAMTATAADGAYVARIDPQTDELVTAAAAGERQPETGTRVPFPGSLAERALLDGVPLSIGRLEDADRPFLGGLARECAECAAILVPLKDEWGDIGALILVRESRRPPFREDEVRRAHAFGQLASLAFRKVQLLEEAEHRRDELERVMESRARLMRGFSHDLKNPLGAADGYAQLLEEGIITDPARQRESLVRIRASIGAALHLIDDLLELARAEAGQLEVRVEPVDVAAVARDVVSEYRAQATAAGLELATERATESPVVGTDQHRVRQILGNLLSNAVKYTPAGGRIGTRVTVRERMLEGRPAVAVEVWDTGPGIAPERREEIFREFTRLDPKAKSGAGLGLAISRRMARALGGELTVGDGPQGGSTFTLLLPLDGDRAGRESDRAA